MTEADWTASTDPFEMLTSLEGLGPVSTRKLRLFALAACRRWWPLLTDPRSRTVVEVAERHVEGLADEGEWERAGLAAWRATYAAGQDQDGLPGPRWKAAWGAWVAGAPPGRPSPGDHRTFVTVTAPDDGGELDPAGESAAHASVLRDLFGNPFHAVSFIPSWRTEAVVGLARGMYESRSFSAMPVLADAMEDAGCAAEDVLAHCRGDGHHARGCWVVDLVLGKT